MREIVVNIEPKVVEIDHSPSFIIATKMEIDLDSSMVCLTGKHYGINDEGEAVYEGEMIEISYILRKSSEIPMDEEGKYK